MEQLPLMYGFDSQDSVLVPIVVLAKFFFQYWKPHLLDVLIDRSVAYKNMQKLANRQTWIFLNCFEYLLV